MPNNPHWPPTEVNYEDLRSLSEAGRLLVDELDRLRAEHLARPEAFALNSPAASDSAHQELSDHIDDALGAAAVRISAAVQQADVVVSWAAGAVEKEESPAFAIYSVARSAVELCALGRWLLEPGLLPRSRVARSLTRRHIDLHNALILKDPRTLDRIERVEGQARSLEFRKVGRRGRQGFETEPPGLTELAETLFASKTPYALLSAVVHGDMWALVNLGFRAEGDGHWRTLYSEVPIFGYWFALYYTVEGLSIAALLESGYRGWDLHRASTIVRGAYEHMGAPAMSLEIGTVLQRLSQPR